MNTSEYYKLKSLKIWEYLIDNPDLGKKDAYDDLNLEEDACRCPACEYVERIGEGGSVGGRGCKSCPMFGKWPATDGVSSVRFCISPGSVYKDWPYTDDPHTKVVSAKIIAEAIKTNWNTEEV